MRRFARRGFEKRAGIEPHQAAVAVFARRQQNDAGVVEVRRTSRALEGLLIGKVDRKRATDDGLDAGCRHLVGEFERTEHVVGVG
jgi:hypothetical protein